MRCIRQIPLYIHADSYSYSGALLKKKQTALFTVFFYWYKWAIETKLLRHVLYSYCGLTHPYVPKRRPFYLAQKSHRGITDEVWVTSFLWKKGDWFYTLSSLGPSSPLMTLTRCHLGLVSWDSGSVWNNQSFFLRKIQKLGRRKPINIWCLDRCSLKYSFPQVKLLSTLLIKRLQKEDCLSFFFPLSLVVFDFMIILWKIKVTPTFSVCMCVCFFTT